MYDVLAEETKPSATTFTGTITKTTNLQGSKKIYLL